MANYWPSGTPTKNTGHALQAYLKAAFIPRSTTQIYEVVSASNMTLPQNGTSYDADGFWFGYASSRQTNYFTFGSAIDGKGPLTLIVGIKRHGTNSPTGDNQIGICGASGIGTIPYHRMQADSGNNNVILTCVDGSSNTLVWDTGDAIFGSSGAKVIGFANDENGGGSALAIERVGGSTIETASKTGIDHYGWDRTQFQLYSDHGWGINFAFVYSGVAMSQEQMEGIADTPTDVITPASGGASGVPKSTRFTMLGVG